jgi:hypothetical protein
LKSRYFAFHWQRVSRPISTCHCGRLLPIVKQFESALNRNACSFSESQFRIRQCSRPFDSPAWQEAFPFSRNDLFSISWENSERLSRANQRVDGSVTTNHNHWL